MRKCEFCSAKLPEFASFCDFCGYASVYGHVTDQGDHFQTLTSQDADDVSNIATLTNLPTHPSIPLHSMSTVPLVTEEEEEKRHRVAVLGFSIPLLGDLGIQSQLPGSVPTIQGTPQVGDVPTISGTPSMPGTISPSFPPTPGASAPVTQPIPGTSALSYLRTPRPSIPDTSTHAEHATHTLTHHHHRYPSHPPRKSRLRRRPHMSRGGCVIRLVIVAIIVPLLVLVTLISLGLTIWAPGLVLSGSSSVALGGTLTLHGRSFLPGSSVTLTLDGGIPLYFAKHSTSPQITHSLNGSATGTQADSISFAVASSAHNVVLADRDGSFTINVAVSPIWSPGKHTIHATEALSHRSASLDFTILQNGTIPSNTPSPMPSNTPNVTATSSLTHSPTLTGTGTPISLPTKTSTPGITSLSCIKPGILNLGPVVEASTQAVSGKVTLCTTGTGIINWKVTSNPVPWLQFDHTGGQIAAPGQAQVTVSASAANLQAGNYHASLSFNGQPGNSIQVLNVSLTVSSSPPCVTATPGSLNFSGVAGASDPASTQMVTVTNCGKIASTWSATINTNSGGNWLSINPAGSLLAPGASTTITITASNLNADLGAGTYTDTILINIGTSSVSVSTTLTVQAPPLISVSPNSIFADQASQCQLSGGQWTCIVTLTNSSNTLSLPWTASSSGLNGIMITPGASGSSVPPGQTEQVQLTIPNFCESTVLFTFQGPTNSSTLSWTCAI